MGGAAAGLGTICVGRALRPGESSVVGYREVGTGSSACRMQSQQWRSESGAATAIWGATAKAVNAARMASVSSSAGGERWGKKKKGAGKGGGRSHADARVQQQVEAADEAAKGEEWGRRGAENGVATGGATGGHGDDNGARLGHEAATKRAPHMKESSKAEVPGRLSQRVEGGRWG